MNPNTRITLAELKDEHLEKVIDIYRSIGLTWDQKVPLANEVRGELEFKMETEFRPTKMDISKMLITQKPFSRTDYIHVYITYNHHANAPDNANKIFDQIIRQKFTH